MTAMSDFVSDVDVGSGGPRQGSAVIFDMQNFVSNCEQMQTWDCVYSIRPEHGEASPESGDQIPDKSVSDGSRSMSVRCNRTREVLICLRSLFGRFLLGL